MAAHVVGRKAATVLQAAEEAIGCPLLAVQLVGSPIGNNYRIKNILQTLKLTTRHRTVIHKNTACVVGLLRAVAREVDIQPLWMKVLPANEYTRLYPGPSEIFVNGAQEVIVKEGSPLAQQWAALTPKKEVRQGYMYVAKD